MDVFVVDELRERMTPAAVEYPEFLRASTMSEEIYRLPAMEDLTAVVLFAPPETEP